MFINREVIKTLEFKELSDEDIEDISYAIDWWHLYHPIFIVMVSVLNAIPVLLLYFIIHNLMLAIIIYFVAVLCSLIITLTKDDGYKNANKAKTGKIPCAKLIGSNLDISYHGLHTVAYMDVCTCDGKLIKEREFVDQKRLARYCYKHNKNIQIYILKHSDNTYRYFCGVLKDGSIKV